MTCVVALLNGGVAVSIFAHLMWLYRSCVDAHECPFGDRPRLHSIRVKQQHAGKDPSAHAQAYARPTVQVTRVFSSNPCVSAQLARTQMLKMLDAGPAMSHAEHTVELKLSIVYTVMFSGAQAVQRLAWS